MEKVNCYEWDGEVFEIPLRWDERTQSYVEDYEDYYDGPVYTPPGRPVLLTIEDARSEADMLDDHAARIDCGSCRHYHQFPNSLLGVCQNEKLKKKRRGRRSGQSTKNKEEIR